MSDQVKLNIKINDWLTLTPEARSLISVFLDDAYFACRAIYTSESEITPACLNCSIISNNRFFGYEYHNLSNFIITPYADFAMDASSFNEEVYSNNDFMVNSHNEMRVVDDISILPNKINSTFTLKHLGTTTFNYNDVGMLSVNNQISSNLGNICTGKVEFVSDSAIDESANLVPINLLELPKHEFIQDTVTDIYSSDLFKLKLNAEFNSTIIYKRRTLSFPIHFNKNGEDTVEPVHYKVGWYLLPKSNIYSDAYADIDDLTLESSSTFFEDCGSQINDYTAFKMYIIKNEYEGTLYTFSITDGNSFITGYTRNNFYEDDIAVYGCPITTKDTYAANKNSNKIPKNIILPLWEYNDDKNYFVGYMYAKLYHDSTNQPFTEDPVITSIGQYDNDGQEMEDHILDDIEKEGTFLYLTKDSTGTIYSMSYE